MISRPAAANNCAGGFRQCLGISAIVALLYQTFLGSQHASAVAGSCRRKSAEVAT